MKRKKIVAVIPARMGSSRFPGKPIEMILDLPMIEHVRRRAFLSESIDEVYVATCDEEIFDVVTENGGKAVMTKPTHERCTDRIEEASYSIDLDIAVIIQGDEPLFEPYILDRLIAPMLEDDTIPVTNLLNVIHRKEDLDDVDIVKAVMDEKDYVMFYSRSPIPHIRVDAECPFYRQTGISAFTKSFLHTFSQLLPTKLEIVESVDFLRIVGHRYPVKGVVYDLELVGVDRPDDIGIVEDILRTDPVQKELYERIIAL